MQLINTVSECTSYRQQALMPGRLAASAVCMMLIVSSAVETRAELRTDNRFQTINASTPATTSMDAPPQTEDVNPARHSDELRTLSVSKGDTLGKLLAARIGLSRSQTAEAVEALRRILDPRALQPGQEVSYAVSKEDNGDPVRLDCLHISRDIDTQAVVLRPNDDRLVAITQKVPHRRSVQSLRFEISDALYSSASAAGVPDPVLLTFYRQFSNRIDFQRELRAGNHVTIAYESFRHGENGPVHSGKLLAGVVEQEARRLALYRFTAPGGEAAYYNADGSSIETTLSRTPVSGSRLSSLFGKREHPVLNYTRTHEGLDFAAPRGTPVAAAGDGRVERVERYGSYGKYIQLRHDAQLQTAYAHLSRYAGDLDPGDKVEQGQTIGYVGATGLTTGPNLHYEVLKDGTPINPRTLELPPRRRLEGPALDAFRARARQLELAMQRSANAERVAHVSDNE